jgi:hypothetical protein
MQVAIVNDDPPPAAVVRQLQRLDPHVRRKAPLDPLADLVRRDLGIRRRHGAGRLQARAIRFSLEGTQWRAARR